MPILSYELIQERSCSDLQDKVNAALPGKQPVGTVVADPANSVFIQQMVETGGAVVTDSMALTGVTPSGAYTNTVTFTVAAGEITAIALS